MMNYVVEKIMDACEEYSVGVAILYFWVGFGLRWLYSLLFKSKVTINKKSEN